METKMNVLDVQIDIIRAKEAMKSVVQYMRTEPVSVVTIVTAQTLIRVEKVPELKEYIQQSDLVLAGERAILEAGGIADKKMFLEVEQSLFIKLFMQFMHKQEHKVFLLADHSENLQQLEAYLLRYYGGIQVTEKLCILEDTQDDLIVNMVNGAEVDCIIASLDSPRQEMLIAQNKALLNASVWFGIGKDTKLKSDYLKPKNIIHSFFTSRTFKRQIIKKQHKKEQ